ncbi:phosphopantetheine-binding protein [Dactylosporangium sp. NPDC048998]|uniref:phosphopantetheine-binding protein n=1 Tax=Dactylosporangium sp. NPDC048998 TaxID=3363976 RepID=UPI0037244219
MSDNTAAIKQYIVEEFLPDLTPEDLPADHDLLADGVIDSLGLLKLIAWIEDRFVLPVADDAMDPDNFRSVRAIDAFVARAQPVANG